MLSSVTVQENAMIGAAKPPCSACFSLRRRNDQTADAPMFVETGSQPSPPHWLTGRRAAGKLWAMSRGGNLRSDGRAHDQIRPVKLTPDFITSAEGSVLIEIGNTRVICTATVDDGVPSFLKGQGKGWVTGEYGMLPRATEQRMSREATRGRPSGRTLEIQRLIGRSLRAIVDQQKLGERTVWLDCDVIQADGGTRTASITGAYVALVLAMERMVAVGILKSLPLTDSVAATSVGMVDGTAML